MERSQERGLGNPKLNDQCADLQGEPGKMGKDGRTGEPGERVSRLKRIASNNDSSLGVVWIRGVCHVWKCYCRVSKVKLDHQGIQGSGDSQ